MYKLKSKVLTASIASLFLYVGCGDKTIIEGGSGETDYTATFVLDNDGDGLAKYPFGPDLDDDNDGLLTRLAGGSDVDDEDASVGKTGKGNGQFSTPHFYWGTEDDPEYAAFADFNNDGWLDPMVLESSLHGIGVQLNQGNQIFNTGVHYYTNNEYDDKTPAIGDFNKDGNLDVAVVKSHNGEESEDLAGIKIVWGEGNGYFSGETDITEFGTGAIRAAVTADFNGDGHLDLAASDKSNARLIVSFNDGNGSFGSTATYDINASEYDECCEDTTYTVGALQFGDLNSDGHVDLVVHREQNGSEESGVDTFINDGNGNFTTRYSVNLPVTDDPNRSDMALGDYNGDNALDLAMIGSDDDNVTISFGDNNGSFTSSISYEIGSSFNGKYVYNVSDINGDGHADIIATEEDDEQIAILRGNGDGNFTVGVLDLGYDVDAFGAMVADFNGDKIFDIAIYVDECCEPQAGLYVVYGQSDDLIVK